MLLLINVYLLDWIPLVMDHVCFPCFLQILKHEWPKKWPTFVGDIVGASKANESLCQNNMVILKLLR